MKLIGILLGLVFALNANAGLEYHSERIKMMDVETLQQIITKNLKRLDNKDENAKPIVKQSIEVLLAQPDQSLAASNYFSQLKNFAGGESEFLAVLEEIISEGVATLKRRGKATELLREQNTYLYILTNLVTELKEYKEQEFYRGLIEKIRDADIYLTDELISYRLLNSMSKAENPSQYALSVVPRKKAWWKFW